MVSAPDWLRLLAASATPGLVLELSIATNTHCNLPFLVFKQSRNPRTVKHKDLFVCDVAKGGPKSLLLRFTLSQTWKYTHLRNIPMCRDKQSLSVPRSRATSFARTQPFATSPGETFLFTQKCKQQLCKTLPNLALLSRFLLSRDGR